MQFCNHCMEETKTIDSDCEVCCYTKVTPSDLIVEVSNLIDTILQHNDIGIDGLARTIGISIIHLCNVYNGKSKPSRMLIKFLKVINKIPKSIEVLKETKEKPFKVKKSKKKSCRDVDDSVDGDVDNSVDGDVDDLLG